MFGVEVTGAVVGAEVVGDQVAIGFYLAYAAIALSLVVWLARTLFRNGEVFLADVFEDDGLARAVNHLLVIGFYLLNLGYALLLYKVEATLTLTGAFNGLVSRVGLLLLSLGVIHLTNMFIFWRIRTHGDRKLVMPPPPRYSMPPKAPTGYGPAATTA